MLKPLVIVGSINLDLVVGADRIPQVGETIIGNSFNTFYGGKGANQAVAAAKLGYPVSMLGNVGNDAFGTQLRNGLEDAGVDTTYVNMVEGASGVALISPSPQCGCSVFRMCNCGSPRHARRLWRIHVQLGGMYDFDSVLAPVHK